MNKSCALNEIKTPNACDAVGFVLYEVGHVQPAARTQISAPAPARDRGAVAAGHRNSPRSRRDRDRCLASGGEKALDPARPNLDQPVFRGLDPHASVL